MTDEELKKKNARILKAQAQALWGLVITTPGMADLAEPLKRAEHHFDRLTQRQRVTVAVIASQLAKRFHEIENQENQAAEVQTVTAEEIPQASLAREETPQEVAASEEVTAEIVRPDAIIRPSQDDIGDGSGTGD